MPNAPINNAAAAGNLTVVAAPAAPQFIRVLAYKRMAGGVTTAQFLDGATPLEGPMPLAAQAGDVMGLPDGVWDLTPGNALVLNVGAAIQVSGHVTYVLKGT